MLQIMRLAVFTSQFPSTVNTFFERDIRALLELGIEIDIYPIYPLDPALWRFVSETLNPAVLPRSRVHHLAQLQAVRRIRPWRTKELSLMARESWRIVRSAARFGVLPVAKSLYVAPKAWAWASTNQNPYDHVLAYWGNYAATCAYLFCRLRHTPFSFFLHAGTDLYRDQVFLLEKLHTASHIFTECDFNRRFLRDLYPSDFGSFEAKLHVHYLGLDLENFLYAPTGRPNNQVIGVGRLCKAKGYEFLLKALALLETRGIYLECDFYGDGPERRRLEVLAAKLRSTVRFHSFKPFGEVRDAMGRATVLVHPSPWIGDATPTVIKEALAVGLPVVASDIVGIPELLNFGKCGLLVAPQDVRGIADAITKIITDEPLRYSLVEAGRRHAEEKFDMWGNGKQMKEVLLNSSFGPVNPKDAPSV